MSGVGGPALAALMAGTAHVHRHVRHPPHATSAVARRLQLRVALNVVRELDTLLGHAVAESADTLGIVLDVRGRSSARAGWAALRIAFDPSATEPAMLERADRLRSGLARAIRTRRGVEAYQLDGIYPLALGAAYRRIGEEMNRALLASRAGNDASAGDGRCGAG